MDAQEYFCKVSISPYNAINKAETSTKAYPQRHTYRIPVNYFVQNTALSSTWRAPRVFPGG